MALIHTICILDKIRLPAYALNLLFFDDYIILFYKILYFFTITQKLKVCIDILP